MITFPYTPGFTHTEALAAPVQVHRFLDFSEQRYKGPGLIRRLSYEFPHVSSAMMLGISSFFLAHGGPRDPFTAVDHRTGTAYMVRFAAPTLDHSRGPHINRSLRLDFFVDNSGTTPIPTSYAPPFIPPFGEPVSPTSGFTEPPPPPDPSSGNPNGLGFSVISQWMVAGVLRGTVQSRKRFLSESPWAWAMPFVVQRSGTAVDKMGVVVTDPQAAGMADLAVYLASSNTDVFPSSRLTIPGSVTLTAAGMQVVSFTPLTFASHRLYYAAMATRSFASADGWVRGYTDGDAQAFPLGYSDSYAAILGWVTASIGALPSTWPTTATAYGGAAGVPLIYLQVCS